MPPLFKGGTVTEKESKEVVDTWTSSKESHDISGLEEGKTYILTENQAPIGYDITESIEFTVEGVDKDGVKCDQHYTMEDAPILSNLVVHKVDSKTKKAITGKDFAFTLYKDKDCKEKAATGKLNKKTGDYTFKDLKYGTYYLKETKQPSGYLISKKVVKVVIDDTVKDGVKTVTFENTLRPGGPKTGDNTPLLLCIVMIVLSMAGFVFFLRKRKNDK